MFNSYSPALYAQTFRNKANSSDSSVQNKALVNQTSPVMLVPNFAAPTIKTSNFRSQSAAHIAMQKWGSKT